MQTFRIAAGIFTAAFQATTTLSAVWRIDEHFRPPALVIEAMAVLPDGDILVGGQFDSVDGILRPSLARLNSDGSLDAGLDAGIGVSDGSVFAIQLLPDGKLLIGGDFIQLGGVARPGLARLLPTGAVDSAFAPEFAPVSVRNIAVASDGRILVNGRIGLLADGTSDPNWARDPTVFSDAAIALPGGEWMIGRFSINRVHSDGSLAATIYDQAGLLTINHFAPGPNGLIAIGGRPTTSAGWAFPFVRLLTANGSQVLNCPVDGYAEVTSLVADANAGLFYGYRNNAYPSMGPWLVRTDHLGTIDRSFDIRLGGGTARVLARGEGGVLYAAGTFTRVDGVDVPGLVRFVYEVDASVNARLVNVSTRGLVGSGENVLIAGFVVEGAVKQCVLIRGIGPGLSAYGVGQLMTEPKLTVFARSSGQVIAENDDWGLGGIVPLHDFPRTGAFELSSNLPRDAAVLLYIDPGAYTVHLSGATSGIGLVEVYDANGADADRRIVNLSTRGRVETGDRVLIGGFSVARSTKRVLIRAVGPGLDAFQVADTLDDPWLEIVRQSDRGTIATNDDWEEASGGAIIKAAAAATGAFPLDAGSKDAAVVLDLPPGLYTAIVRGVGATSGIALVETYEVDKP